MAEYVSGYDKLRMLAQQCEMDAKVAERTPATVANLSSILGVVLANQALLAEAVMQVIDENPTTISRGRD